MSERATLIGATLAVEDANARGGCRVRLEVPLDELEKLNPPDEFDPSDQFDPSNQLDPPEQLEAPAELDAPRENGQAR
jgi:hypothetical protein